LTITGTAKAELLLRGIANGDQIGGPTEMARIVHDSLSACRRLDAGDLAQRYLNWWQNGAFDTGPTFALVFGRVAKGMTITQAVEEVDKQLGGQTAGCGPAQRIPPLASCMFIPTAQIGNAAREEARITHYHHHAGDAAAIVALLCRRLIEGHSWEQAKDYVAQDAPEAWAAIQGASLCDGGYALDVVRTAIHILDGEDALPMAMKFSGRQNYCPVVVGAIDAVRGS
jgi:ADP-ribosyl-[dinitrogen reductase] hydrolase